MVYTQNKTIMLIIINSVFENSSRFNLLKNLIFLKFIVSSLKIVRIGITKPIPNVSKIIAIKKKQIKSLKKNENASRFYFILFFFTQKIRKKNTDCEPCQGARLSRSEEHTSELQSRTNLVCRLLLEKKK